MEKINQRLDMIATALIIIVTIILGAVLIKQFFINSPTSAANKNNVPAQSQPVASSQLKIDGFDFSAQPKTVVIALQRGCPYCSKSAPFYKRLIENTKDKNVKVIAVLPSSVEESREYLEKLGIDNLEIKEDAANDLQVQGTPTLFLADDKGEVINAWRGMLSPTKEEDVISTVLQ